MDFYSLERKCEIKNEDFGKGVQLPSWDEVIEARDLILYI